MTLVTFYFFKKLGGDFLPFSLKYFLKKEYSIKDSLMFDKICQKKKIKKSKKLPKMHKIATIAYNMNMLL